MFKKRRANKPALVQNEKQSTEENDKLYLVIPNYARQLPMKSPTILRSFVEGHQKLISKYVLSCLKLAIAQNNPEVVLFRLGESTLIAKITKDDYEPALRTLDSFFLKIEEYESVQQCRDCINKIHVNRVIDESKKM
jgi:hypothetical protein